MMNWHGLRGFSGGGLAVSALNLVVVEMNTILWAWLAVNVVLFLVSNYKIWKGK